MNSQRFVKVAYALAVGLVFLLVYVLSFGPACALVDRGVITPPTIEVVYAPVIWVCDRNDTARDLLTWYMNLLIAPRTLENMPVPQGK